MKNIWNIFEIYINEIVYTKSCVIENYRVNVVFENLYWVTSVYQGTCAGEMDVTLHINSFCLDDLHDLLTFYQHSAHLFRYSINGEFRLYVYDLNYCLIFPSHIDGKSSELKLCARRRVAFGDGFTGTAAHMYFITFICAAPTCGVLICLQPLTARINISCRFRTWKVSIWCSYVIIYSAIVFYMVKQMMDWN